MDIGVVLSINSYSEPLFAPPRRNARGIMLNSKCSHLASFFVLVFHFVCPDLYNPQVLEP